MSDTEPPIGDVPSIDAALAAITALGPLSNTSVLVVPMQAVSDVLGFTNVLLLAVQQVLPDARPLIIATDDPTSVQLLDEADMAAHGWVRSG